jgi:hypothetical protein
MMQKNKKKRIREVVGVFSETGDMEQAMAELANAGFRSARRGTCRQARPGGYIQPGDRIRAG